ncbi:MAG: sigma-70 family RNA polymerase sigma factor [Muribaculaceae bacterium]
MSKVLTNLHTNDTLWNDFLEGDRDAFAQLFNDYSNVMFAYGYKILGDREQVKDSIQDVFVKLYSNRRNISRDVNAKAYLFISLKNTLLNKIERLDYISTDHSVEVKFEMELIHNSEYDEENESSFTDGQRIELKEALKELTPRQREAIYLYYIQEIPLKDIPQLLGMSYQSTRNLLHRSILKLRSHITNGSGLCISAFLLQFLSK